MDTAGLESVCVPLRARDEACRASAFVMRAVLGDGDPFCCVNGLFQCCFCGGFETFFVPACA
ncbi:hypothetical protein [Bartonella grahamii]|uniref:hypothetical protein n=1 Tax=Bartonella grahamii TaxID=33045 RepID=UPI002E7B4339|nr:hypothetical protein [Bartonella grahamii]